MNKNIHEILDSMMKAIKVVDSLHLFHKEKIIKAIEYAKKLNGCEPNPHQKLSDLFYDDVNMDKLFTGDLLDVRKLNENLTEFHKYLGLYGVEEDFAKKFYPYFFDRYQYACVVTQDCKIEHGKVRSIEICAIKPMTIRCASRIRVKTAI